MSKMNHHHCWKKNMQQKTTTHQKMKLIEVNYKLQNLRDISNLLPTMKGF